MGSTFFEKAVPAQAGIPAGRLLDYLKALENRRLHAFRHAGEGRNAGA